MRQEIRAENARNESGIVTGGRVGATGIDIQWQDGPLDRREVLGIEGTHKGLVA